MLKLRAIAVLALAATTLVAQPATLTTTFTTNNGQAGNMFDLRALNDVSVTGFSINMDVVTADVEVYALGGSWTSDPTNMSGSWTLVDTFTGITGAGLDVPTVLPPLSQCVAIGAGQTVAFYVTLTSSTGLNYLTAPAGTNVGDVFASDTNLEFLAGSGNVYPFGTQFQPRIFSGDINYIAGSTSGCLTPGSVMVPYQTNGAIYALDVDGIQATAFSPAVSLVGTNVVASLNFTQAAGTPVDTAIDFGGISMPSVLTTANNQVINVNVASPALTWLNGPALNPLPSIGSFSLPVSLPVPFVATAQTIALDPVAPDGFFLTQAAQHEVTVCTPTDDFDALQTGANLPLGWSNSGTNTWTVQTGGTGSVGTGPTAAFNGTNYLYAETSVAGGATYIFETCGEDIGNLSSLTLDFALSRIGDSIGTLNIFLDDGTGTFATLLATYSGPDTAQTQGGTEWSNESISFASAITTATVAFRFEYTSLTTAALPVGGASFRGDLAIDDMQVN